jgi:hypothetical protein
MLAALSALSPFLTSAGAWPFVSFDAGGESASGSWVVVEEAVLARAAAVAA